MISKDSELVIFFQHDITYIPKGFQVDGRRSSVEDRSVHEYVKTGDREDQRTSSLKGEKFSTPKGFQVDGRRSSVEDRSVHEYVRTGDHEDQRNSSFFLSNF